MNPLLITIVGQTATGKTGLALKLAQALKQNYSRLVLLSADSKQVFQGLEILTGADIPDGFTKVAGEPYPYWEKEGIELHGIAMIPGDSDWSAAHFQQLFHQIYGQLKADEALIVVGGTGLYHQQVFEPAATMGVRPNPALRSELTALTLEALQEKLQQLAKQRWEEMNHSDRHNPRRLIRAIEVALADQPQTDAVAIKPTLQFGLELPLNEVENRIEQRVAERLASDVIQEVQQFEASYPTGVLQAKAALGYSTILNFLQEKISLPELKLAWALSELQYAKRQQTWWKKRAAINWLEDTEIDKIMMLIKDKLS